MDVRIQCSDGILSNPQGSKCTFVHGCIEHRLGCALVLLRCVVDDQESTSHQCARVRGHTPNSAPLAEAAHGPKSSCCIRQLHGSILHQQAGQDTVNIAVQMDKRLLLMCQNSKIVLRARHIPRRMNVLVDILSCPTQVPGTEWSLHPSVFQAVIREWGIPLLDLFTRWNHKLLIPCPGPIGHMLIHLQLCYHKF